MKSSGDGALTPCLFYRRNSNTKSLKVRKTVYDRKFPAEPAGCYDNLCLHRLRKRGRIHLSSGGADVGRTGQGTETCMDRLPDGGRNLTWNPGGKRSLSLRQSGKCCLSAGQGRLSHGYQFFQSPDVKIRQHGKRVSQKRPGSDFCGSCHDLCPRNDREQRAGDPFVHQDSLLPGDR